MLFYLFLIATWPFIGHVAGQDDWQCNPDSPGGYCYYLDSGEEQGGYVTASDETLPQWQHGCPYDNWVTLGGDCRCCMAERTQFCEMGKCWTSEGGYVEGFTLGEDEECREDEEFVDIDGCACCTGKAAAAQREWERNNPDAAALLPDLSGGDNPYINPDAQAWLDQTQQELDQDTLREVNLYDYYGGDCVGVSNGGDVCLPFEGLACSHQLTPLNNWGRRRARARGETFIPYESDPGYGNVGSLPDWDGLGTWVKGEASVFGTNEGPAFGNRQSLASLSQRIFGAMRWNTCKEYANIDLWEARLLCVAAGTGVAAVLDIADSGPYAFPGDRILDASREAATAMGVPGDVDLFDVYCTMAKAGTEAGAVGKVFGDKA